MEYIDYIEMISMLFDNRYGFWYNFLCLLIGNVNQELGRRESDERVGSRLPEQDRTGGV